MRSLCLVLLLIACGGSKPAPVTPVAPMPVVAPAPPPRLQPATLDEATVKERSRAFYEAMDTDNVPAVQAVMGPSFVVFDQARSYNAEHVVSRMTARADRQAPKRTRTWKEERVYLGPNTAVFIGNAVEAMPAVADQKAAEWEGWNTVVWTHDGGDWKVAHAQWQVGGLEAERSMWNEAYRKAIGFKQTANQHLIDTVKGRKPGTALDIAMGQGRNAVFLATKGWKVTGIDISDEGIRVAKEAAAKARVKLTAVQADNETYDFGKDKWDLVTLIYAGNNPSMIEKIKPSIKKGGVFVVEYFHKDATGSVGIGGFADGELAMQFAGWKVQKDEVVEDIADWGLRKLKLVRFTAQKP
ncbi:MAG: methyltransferase domain-containing protein [Deltaproteobacteria bacterium]|nr:methyltransferase domain-containing protein [Deltaproteobacteria bacterium]